MSQSKRALLADDDPIVRHILGAILTAAGYSIDVVENGENCLAKLQTIDGGTQYDVLFLDMMLGDMTGMDVLRKIRPTISFPVIMLSAHQRDEALRFAGDMQPDAFLEKPFVAQTVSDALVSVGLAG